MIVSAPHVERVPTFEPEQDTVLIVHAHRVVATKVTSKRVQPIPGGHFQVIEPRHGVDLIQLATDDWPDVAGDATSRLTVDAVPNIAGCLIGQRPDHQ